MGTKGYKAQFDLSHSEPRTFPELSKRTGQVVLVLNKVKLSMYTVDDLYRVRFEDGYEGNAYQDELLCLHDEEDDFEDCLLAGRFKTHKS